MSLNKEKKNWEERDRFDGYTIDSSPPPLQQTRTSVIITILYVYAACALQTGLHKGPASLNKNRLDRPGSTQ